MELLESNDHILTELSGNADKRTSKWPLISSSVPVFCIIIFYLYFLYFIGPRFMKNRRPYSLKKFIQYYNIFQILSNFWIVYSYVTHGGWWMAIWRYCDSIDNVCNSNAVKGLEILWWTLLLKIIDLIETIIFVLRKKNQQISILHVYHHASTVVICWFLLKYLPHAYILTVFVMNCTVHVIMYVYYFLSTYEQLQPWLLRYKKIITIIQMIQLSFMVLISLQGFLLNCDNKSRYVSVIVSVNCMTNLLLFFNFYLHAYNKKKIA